MKTLLTAVTSVLLVSLFHKVHPSNPDSEVMQNTSTSDVNHEQKRSAPYGMVEVTRERTIYVQHPWITFRVIRLPQVAKGIPPRTEFVTEANVFNDKGLPQQHTYNSYNRMNSRNDQNTNTGWNRENPLYPTNPPNTPDYFYDNSNRNKNPSVQRDVYNPGSTISPDGARNYGNEGSYNREQTFRQTFPNGHRTRQNSSFNSSNGVNRRNGLNTNNRGNSRYPTNRPYNPYDISYNRGVSNRNDNPSTRRPGSDTFDAPKTVTKISPDSNLYVSIINDFGFKLIEKMNLRTNFVLSPLSIFLALSMCYLGSNGTTKVQLEEVMGLNNYSVHGQTFHQGIKDLISSILLESPNYKLYLANGLFFAKDFEYMKDFERDIRKFYNGEVQKLDFGNPQQSASVVDEWVSRITRNMIPKLGGEGGPSLLTRLLVVNAIFFKGIWKTQFPPSMTFPGKFFSSFNSEKTVPTMQLFNETFPFYRNQRTSFIKLPYEGGQVSLIIALPLNIGENPVPNMRDDTLCNIQYAFNDTTIGTVAIPKFGFNYELSLIEPLKQLGITDLFNINKANLDKITHEKIAVSAILHKAVIDIDEQGTSASAITSFQLTFQTKKKDPDFIVNHPFAFYIVHEPTGVVLFNGKIFDIGQRKGEVPNNPSDSRYPSDSSNPSYSSYPSDSRNPSYSRYPSDSSSSSDAKEVPVNARPVPADVPDLPKIRGWSNHAVV